jgi:hypothetical protein
MERHFQGVWLRLTLGGEQPVNPISRGKECQNGKQEPHDNLTNSKDRLEIVQASIWKNSVPMPRRESISRHHTRADEQS